MKHLNFPKQFRHSQSGVQDVNILLAEQSTPGERAADRVAAFISCWPSSRNNAQDRDV